MVSKTRFYKIWLGMRKRCNNVNHVSYPDYGGRGVGYQKDWDDFKNFERDMRETYSDNLSLERKDVNGHYTKENCEWIPLKDQAKNKRAYKNNKLGMSNLKLITNKGIPTLQARIQDPKTKKRVMRWYSLKLYSFEEAKTLADNWLSNKRKEFGYKEGHGS